LARAVHENYFQPHHEEFDSAHGLEPVERVHVLIQGVGRRAAVPGDGETCRIPGGSTVTGDLILQGDCATVLRSFDAGSVDFVLADPPYLARYPRPDRANRPKR
jgi:hypothetical protein